MAKFAYFRVVHESYNREEWGYGRVAAAARYAANRNKLGAIATVGLPIPSNSYEAARAFKALEEKQTRKNARLGDTLIISFPVEIKDEHRLLMMERYLDRVTFGGKSYAQAFEHTDHAHNPHFHVVLHDYDRISGKSVGKFGHSRSYRKKKGLEPNVTVWLRKQWEEVGNELSDEFGYDLTFDMRTNVERGLGPAGTHKGYEMQADNDNTEDKFKDLPEVDEWKAEPPPPQPVEEPPVETPAEEPEVEEYVPELIEEEDEDYDLIRFHEADISTAAYRIRNLYASVGDLNHLHDLKDRLEKAEGHVERLAKERDAIAISAGTYQAKSQFAVMQAEKALADFDSHSVDGKLKGVGVKLFGMEFKSAARKRAEEAEQRAVSAQAVLAHVEIRQRELNDDVQRAYNTLLKAEAEAIRARNELAAVLAKETEYSTAQRVLEKDVQDNLENVSMAEAIDAYNHEEITEDELYTYAIQTGNAAFIDWVENTVINPNFEEEDTSPEV